MTDKPFPGYEQRAPAPGAQPSARRSAPMTDHEAAVLAALRANGHMPAAAAPAPSPAPVPPPYASAPPPGSPAPVAVAPALGVVSATIVGRDGRAHNYIVREHPASEGIEVGLQLLAALSSTLVTFLGGVLSSEGGFERVATALTRGGFDDDDVSAIAEVLEGSDLSKVGADAASFLAAKTTPRLLRRLLQHTWRDGKHLNLTPNFDSAFSSNYLELSKAIALACRVNGFFPDRSTSRPSQTTELEEEPPPKVAEMEEAPPDVGVPWNAPPGS